MRFTGFVIVWMATATVAAAQSTQTTQATQTTQVTGRGSGLAVRGPMEAGAPLVLEIGARQYGANNQVGGSASNSAATGKFESYVWTTNGLCGMSASSTEPSGAQGTGWHFTGEVMPARNGTDQLTVTLSWQRLWSNGARVPENARNSGSQTITLRAGERIVLDRVLPSGQSPCGAVDAQLEAAVVAQPAYRMVFNGQSGAPGGGGRGGRAMAGPTGQQGGRGQQGVQGQPGVQGAHGQPGHQGQAGQQCQAGQEGQRGQQGQHVAHAEQGRRAQ